MIQYNDNVYQSNLLRLLTQNDYNTLNNSIQDVINTNIPNAINHSIIYGSSSTSSSTGKITVGLGTTYKYCIVFIQGSSTGPWAIAGAFKYNNTVGYFRSDFGEYVGLQISASTSTSFNVRCWYSSSSKDYSINFTYLVFV